MAKSQQTGSLAMALHLPSMEAHRKVYGGWGASQGFASEEGQASGGPGTKFLQVQPNRDE